MLPTSMMFNLEGLYTSDAALLLKPAPTVSLCTQHKAHKLLNLNLDLGILACSGVIWSQLKQPCCYEDHFAAHHVASALDAEMSVDIYTKVLLV